jgi:hypothetical protein
MTPKASPVPQVSRPAREPGAPLAGHTRRPRPLLWVGRALVGLGCSALLGWMAPAIYFDFSLLGPPWLRAELGAIDRSLPFFDLKAKSHTNERAKAAAEDPRFSVRIRDGLPRMSPDPNSGGGTQ